MERVSWVLSVLVLILFIAIIGLSSSLYTLHSAVTGLAYESTISQAIVGKYVAISKSGNLTDGIDFGNITVLPSYDVNATMNYNGTTNQSWENETLYWIELSNQSNVNADFCIRSTAFNTSGGAEIELGNYTWNDTTANDFDNPDFTNRFAMWTNETYKKGMTDVAPGSNNYYRFWLNVTDYVQPGTYNSTVWFEGVPTGEDC